MRNRYGDKIALIGRNIIISFFKKKSKTVSLNNEKEKKKGKKKGKDECDDDLDLDDVAVLRGSLNKLANDIKNYNESKEAKKDIMMNNIDKWDMYGKKKEWGFSFIIEKKLLALKKHLFKITNGIVERYKRM